LHPAGSNRAFACSPHLRIEAVFKALVQGTGATCDEQRAAQRVKQSCKGVTVQITWTTKIEPGERSDYD